MHNTDRNFDDIAEHFSKKVYGGLKGDIRLAVLRRDLLTNIKNKQTKLGRPLRILDIGAGLAQISLELAHMGHDVTINDISENMIEKAKQQSRNDNDENNDEKKYTLTKAQQDSIHWLICPYQQLTDTLNKKDTKKYDVILCHALLEWLAEPNHFITFARNWLTDTGLLSLCFYNPASFVYRNLVMGNFNLLNNPDYKSDNKKSLTPNNPVDKEDVFVWLKQAGFEVEQVSGLRVFHDYSPLKRGGHNHPEQVIEMEVKYSNQEPFKWMGRYLHVMASMEVAR